MALAISTPSRETPGERARRIRERLKLTIAEVAAKAGIGGSGLCDFENGKRDVRVETLRKIAGALKVRPSTLIDA